MASDNNQESSSTVKELFNVAWKYCLKSYYDKIANMLMCPVRDAKNLGKQDPRRITHSCKVGLAVTLVSLLYYFDFFYEGFGVSAMWAVMTVIIIFDFSVGATLGKGVNRGVATVIGGALGLVAHRLTSFNGKIVEFSVLGFFIFLTSALATFIRFFPKVKARYDYGLLVFILSFCLISVSGYRDDEVILMAYRRLTTVMIGGCLTVFISIFVCPIWAGEDLHNLTANNIEKLGVFLEGFGRRYFETINDKRQEKKASPPDGYIMVLNSKSTEDTLVNVAKWEPRHGRFKYWHPWDQYLKIGADTRECACKIDALNCYLNSRMQTPMKIRTKIQEPCNTISLQCGHALRELSNGIKKMSSPTLSVPHIRNAEAAAKRLESQLQSGKWIEIDFLELVPAAAVALLLVEIVSCTAKISDSVHELASLSNFKTAGSTVKTTADKICLEKVVVTRVSDDHKVSLLC